MSININSSSKRRQSGDTIVEVLLATVIISVVVASAYALTNRATRGNQAAIERTAVANLMRQQIELIRGIRSSGYNQNSWLTILSRTQTPPPNYSTCDGPTNNNGFFIIDNPPNLQDDTIVQTYSNGPPVNDAYPNDLFRIWVEAFRTGTEDFVDFHVRACWTGIGDQGEQRDALVMRLQS